ncbi:hypothetical protein [Shewanella sp. YIC-542]|uniref:hypothetical protein n=1 Tax=Shewanella mytili TaxID=3377111 RepID=UPI00398E8C8C
MVASESGQIIKIPQMILVREIKVLLISMKKLKFVILVGVDVTMKIVRMVGGGFSPHDLGMIWA